jgi:hypothetical protein
MTDWVVFIPREKSIAETKDVDGKGSLVEQAKAWVQHSDGKLTDERVICGDTALPTTTLASPATTLYIMGGHGKEGQAFITWPGNSNFMCSHQLVDKIITAGLPSTYAGKIKIYSCLSADNTGSSIAFAKRVALYMAKRGYRSCTVWGYSGAVSKGYVNSGTATAPVGLVAKLQFKKPEELGQGYHRYATVTGGYGPRAHLSRKNFTVAAQTQSDSITIDACNICNYGS